jgi:hypothetical protein
MQKHPRSARHETPPDGSVERPSDEERPEGMVREERAILCASCSGPVTSPACRIAVQGSYDHRFVNPAGLLFHIGCFGDAIGCRIVGPDSLDYPWFPGFAWRYAMCGSCGQHLGWHFRSDGQPSFFGLILDRLVEPAADV